MIRTTEASQAAPAVPVATVDNLGYTATHTPTLPLGIQSLDELGQARSLNPFAPTCARPTRSVRVAPNVILDLTSIIMIRVTTVIVIIVVIVTSSPSIDESQL